MGASSSHVAGRLDRDVRQVHDDVQLLSQYRIVHFKEAGGANRPFVPETVRIEVELEAPAAAEPGPATSDRGGSGG